jgi:hypothetical protein
MMVQSENPIPIRTDTESPGTRPFAYTNHPPSRNPRFWPEIH